MLKKVAAIVLSLAMLVGMTACGGSNDGAAEETKDTIKIAISSDMQPYMDIIQPLVEDAGYKVEVLSYDDWTAPNTALMEGEADANFFQHTPYMELFNEENDADLVMLQPLLQYSLYGLFSEKYESMDDIEDGAHVAITSDPTNRQISLQLLEEAGLIKLADAPVADYYDVADVVENPKNLQFDLMEYYTIFTVTKDEELFIVSSREYLDNGGDPTKAFYRKGNEGDALGITVRAENAETQWAKDLIAAVATDAYKDGVNEKYPDCCGFAY